MPLLALRLPTREGEEPEKELARYVDITDVASASIDQKEATILTRSLAAFAVLHLGDTTPELAGASVTDGTNDNGIGAVFFDRTEKVLIVAQSKWHSDGRGSIERGDCQKLITGINDLVNTRFDRFNEKVGRRAQEIEAALFDAQTRILLVLIHTAYSDESGHRFRANPATYRSPATQGLRCLSEVAGFRPVWPAVFAWILPSG